MKKRTKTIVAIGVVLAVLVAGFLIFRHFSNSVTVSDHYETMTWGMSAEEVKAESEKLGDTWNDEPKEIADKLMYFSEGTEFTGNKKVNYKIIYTFREDKLWSAQMSFKQENMEADLDDFCEQIIKAYDKKYESSSMFDAGTEENRAWESEDSIITLIKMESSMILAYENIDAKEEYKEQYKNLNES